MLVSSHLLNFVHKAKIDIGYRSDHSIVLIDIVFSHFVRGKGFWKFNNSLLKDKEYVVGVKKVIVSLKHQYAEKSDSLEAIEQIPDALLSLTIDYQSFFEQILLHIRGYTIEYSSRKKRNRVNKQKEIEEKMTTIRNNEYETNNDELILLQNELELIRKEHMKGLMVRARAKWIEKGEKPTKYFLALEKRNYINKTISKIANDSGVLITNQQEILNEI